MKICFLTIGSHGDVRPYVALGKGLQAAGHQVKIATHQEFEAWIRSHGLDFHAVKGNPREILQSDLGQQVMQSGSHVLKFLKSFKAAAIDSMREGFDDCLKACLDVDMIFTSFFVMPIAIHISKHLGIPCVQAYLQPYTATSQFPIFMLPQLNLGAIGNRLSYTLAYQLFWQTFGDEVKAWAKRSLNQNSFRRGPFQEIANKDYPVLNGFSKYLIPTVKDWPDWVCTSGFWFLDEATQWQPDPDFQRFLDAGEKPVYVGFGSMNSSDPVAMSQMVIEALKDCGQRGVLMTGWGGLSQTNVSDDIFILDKAPHDALFPLMSAVVHHAGAGTTAAGLRAGIPNVCIPHFGDQDFWAYRCYSTGVSPAPIPRKRLNRHNLARALAQVTAYKDMRHKAVELGQKIQTENGVQQAIQFLRQHYPNRF